MSKDARRTPFATALAQLAFAHPLMIAALALTAVTMPQALLRGQPRDAVLVTLAFGLLIFIGELARVSLPGDREASPLATAGGLGYALLGSVGGTVVTHSVAVVVTTTAFASGAGAMLHAAVGRDPRVDTVARRLLVVGLAAELMTLLSGHVAANAPRDRIVWLMVAVAAVAGGVDVVLAALDRRWRLHTPFLSAFRSELRSMIGLGAAIGATGVLIPLAARRMDLWALPALSLPLLVTQFSFRRYAAIRETYGQTIRALSRITEVGGYVVDGHAERVTTIAVQIGRNLGMTEDELLDLEYAALLHDVGQISLDDPIPRGSTLVVSPQHRIRVAGLGAEIIRSSGFLDRVATLVERQAEPYRRNRRSSDDTVPLGSRIIKAVSAYDDLVSEAGDAGVRGRGDALERLRLGMAYEYDPRVVEALADVVTRMVA